MLLTGHPNPYTLCKERVNVSRVIAPPAWFPGARQARVVASSRAAARPRRVSSDNPGGACAPPAHATPGEAEFEARFLELVAWKETYYECIVPRKVGQCQCGGVCGSLFVAALQAEDLPHPLCRPWTPAC